MTSLLLKYIVELLSATHEIFLYVYLGLFAMESDLLPQINFECEIGLLQTAFPKQLSKLSDVFLFHPVQFLEILSIRSSRSFRYLCV